MTREEAIRYLKPIADSAMLKNYQDALQLAIEALDLAERYEDALDNVVWYNGMEGVQVWAEYLRGPAKRSYHSRPRTGYGDDQYEMLWMILVTLFGNYGTSPRSGWIEKPLEAASFIDRITKTIRYSEEYDGDSEGE